MARAGSAYVVRDDLAGAVPGNTAPGNTVPPDTVPPNTGRGNTGQGKKGTRKKGSEKTGPEGTGPGETARGETAPGNVDKLYPYTLKGLTDALEEARFRSYAGPPQVVLVKAESGLKPIRRYEKGREAQSKDSPG